MGILQHLRIAALFVLPGCGGIWMHHEILHPPPYVMQPRDAEEVEIRMAPPERPHTQVVLMEINQDVETIYARSPLQLLRMMRESAGRLGCDGLIFLGHDSTVTNDITVTGFGILSFFSSSRSLYNARTTCYVYNRPKRQLVQREPD